MKYQNASKQDLDCIETNECNAGPSLVTGRFQAAFNEIHRLRKELEAAQRPTPVVADGEVFCIHCGKITSSSFIECQSCGRLRR